MSQRVQAAISNIRHDATTPTKTRRHFVGTVKNPTPVQIESFDRDWLRTSWSGVRISPGAPSKTPIKQGFLSKSALIATSETGVGECAELCRNVRKMVRLVRRAFVGQYADLEERGTAPGTQNSQAEPAKRQTFFGSEPLTVVRGQGAAKDGKAIHRKREVEEPLVQKA